MAPFPSAPSSLPSPSERSDPVLGDYIRHHLQEKKRSGRVVEQTFRRHERYLGRAVRYFGAARKLASIHVTDLPGFIAFLRTFPNHTGGTLTDGTIRNHLNVLSNLYRRAISEGVVAPGYNPVAALMDKPTWQPTESNWLEVPEAALYLEAARRFRSERLPLAGRRFHAIVATFLLTGGRKSEVLGLDVDDVNLERRTIEFRPNRWRRLKTRSSHRAVPIWPQLLEILEAYLESPAAPASGRLFPSPTDPARPPWLRSILDRAALAAGFPEGHIRTRIFRHTYCAARLQTLDGGAPIAVWTVAREMGHGGRTLVDRIYGHLGEVRHRAEVVEYRVEQHREARERLDTEPGK